MLSFSELRPGVIFIKDGQPHIVLEYLHVKKQQRRPVAQLKLKNLITGKVQEYTAHNNESFEEANLEKKTAEFIYSNRGECWFRDPEKASERFSVSEDIVGDNVGYLKEGAQVLLINFQDEIIGIEPPPKVELKVIEAPPNIKGSTADGGNKKVRVETGLEVKTPLFIEVGDIIKVNTQTGEYAERAEKG